MCFKFKTIYRLTLYIILRALRNLQENLSTAHTGVATTQTGKLFEPCETESACEERDCFRKNIYAMQPRQVLKCSFASVINQLQVVCKTSL